MGWQAIIAAILQAVGPLLVEWLKKWLESLLNRSAANLPAGTESAHALLTEAFQSTPRLAFGRRALLRMMLRHARELESGELSLDAAEDIRTAGSAAAES